MQRSHSFWKRGHEYRLTRAISLNLIYIILHLSKRNNSPFVASPTLSCNFQRVYSVIRKSQFRSHFVAISIYPRGCTRRTDFLNVSFFQLSEAYWASDEFLEVSMSGWRGECLEEEERAESKWGGGFANGDLWKDRHLSLVCFAKLLKMPYFYVQFAANIQSMLILGDDGIFQLSVSTYAY